MAVRAMIAASDTELLVLASRNLYSVDVAGTPLRIGSIATDGNAYMALNRAGQVGIVSEGFFFGYKNKVLSAVTDADAGAPTSIAFLDGYFGMTQPDGRWNITAADNVFSVDPLDFAAAESNPDGATRIATQGREFVVFGPKSMEFWADTPSGQTVDFPFTRSTARDIGILAPNSVATVDQVLHWIAHDGTVRRLFGYRADRISTHAVERSISQEAVPSLIRGTSWSRNGHNFLCLSGEKFTWVYDATTKFWHERQSQNRDRWKIATCIDFAGKIVVGDAFEDTLYSMAPEYDDEVTDPLVMTVQTPAVHAYPNLLRFDAVMIDAIPGVGINSGATQDDSPELMIASSRDAGFTWSPERRVAVGGMGKRATRVETRRLGQSGEDGYVFKVSMSAKVVKGITGMAARIQKVEV